VKALVYGLGLISLLPGCGMTDQKGVNAQGDASRGIINGTVVGSSDPISSFTASLSTSLGSCSATILNTEYALTAAHCIPATGAVFGATLTIKNVPRTVDTVIRHESYVPNGPLPQAYDIGLVHFLQGLPPGAAAVGLPLSTANYALSKISSMVQAGYGVTSAGNDYGTLRETNGTGAIYQYPGADMFSLFAAPGTICSGDSGGPTLFKFGNTMVEVGINSEGSCLNGSSASAMVDVRNYIGWITSKGVAITQYNTDGGYSNPYAFFLNSVKTANTTRGYIELHSLSDSSSYQSFSTHVELPLGTNIASSFLFASSGPDLVAYQIGSTASGYVEAHTLAGTTSPTGQVPYTWYNNHTILPVPTAATGLYQGVFNYSFTMANDRLAFIKKANTSSGFVEINLQAQGSPAYETFITGVPQDNSGNYNFMMAGSDLVALKIHNTASGMLEVLIYPASTNYRSATVNAISALPLTDVPNFSFTLRGKDLVMVKRANTGYIYPGTNVHGMEVHILSGSTGHYNNFLLQVGIPLSVPDSVNFGYFTEGANSP